METNPTKKESLRSKPTTKGIVELFTDNSVFEWKTKKWFEFKTFDEAVKHYNSYKQ